MTITSTALTLAASVLAWAVGFSLFIVALRRRWFSGYVHGFFFSLAIAVAGAAAMSAMVVGRWGFLTARESVNGEITTALENVASIVDGQIGSDLRQMRSTMGQVATLVGPLVETGKSAQLRERLEAAAQLDPHYLQLRVVDAHGDVIGSSHDSQPEPLGRVAAAYALDGTVYVSDAFSSAAYQSEVVVLAVPVKHTDGTIIGAVTAVFDLRAVLEELVVSSRFNQSGYAVIVDGEGDVIAHSDRTQLGTFPEKVAGQEQHSDRDQVGKPQGPPGVRKKEKRQNHRECGHEDQEEYTQRPKPVRPVQARIFRGLRTFHHLDPDSFQLRRHQHGSDDLRQGRRYRPSSPLGIRRLPDGTEGPQVAPLVGEASHEIHDRVDQTPRQIAANRPVQHRPQPKTLTPKLERQLDHIDSLLTKQMPWALRDWLPST